MKKSLRAVIIVAALGSAATAAGAADFTFRMIKPPPPGKKKLIDIQVLTPVAPPPDPAAPAVPDSPQLTFWDVFEPELQAADDRRFPAAVTYMERFGERDGYAPASPERMLAIARDHGVDVLEATLGTSVSPALALAVISVESGGDPKARSSAGAAGLMQLMPETAKRFDVDDPLKASENIRGGVAYLDWLLKEFGRDPILALAAYNAGEGAVRRNGGVPPFAETRAYVPKVIEAWRIARAYCLTPPVFATDGCVLVNLRVARN
ncbi:MAG: lytic transglycosylase domain-containing protein [Paracoccaceae bacterium]